MKSTFLSTNCASLLASEHWEAQLDTIYSLIKKKKKKEVQKNIEKETLYIKMLEIF